MARIYLYLLVSVSALAVVVASAVGAIAVAMNTVSQEHQSRIVGDIVAGHVSYQLQEVSEQALASVLFVGDVMLDRTVADRSRRAGNLLYPFVHVMDDERFTGADVRVANLEGPMTAVRRPPDKEIDFAFDPAFLPVLKSVGFAAVSQANNHSWDQGEAGALESRARLQAAGFLVFGNEVHDDAEWALATTTVNGIRLAMVGFNTVSNPMDEVAATQTIERARQSADTVIAFMHWGEEYRDHPTVAVVERAHWLIDHGVDIVIGAHPHWVQGLSIYKGKPIVYSLGNFVFDQDWSNETRQGLAVRISFLPTILQFDLLPLMIDQSRPRFVDGTERTERLQALSKISDAALRDDILRGIVFFSNTR